MNKYILTRLFTTRLIKQLKFYMGLKIIESIQYYRVEFLKASEKYFFLAIIL
jgi:hypothetical protein